MPARQCQQCGATVAEEARFCGDCGHPFSSVPASGLPPQTTAAAAPPGPRVLPPEPSSTGPVASSGLPSLTWRSGQSYAGLPLELWAVIALFALPGAWLLVEALRGLPSLFDTFSFSGTFGLLLLILLALAAAVGAALLYVAYRLYRRDRVGRGLAYVVTGVLVAQMLFDANRTGGEVVAGLAALAAAAVLALSPAVREAFTGAEAPGALRPTSIVVAQTSLLVWVVVFGLGALVDLLAGANGAGARYVVVGLLMAAVTAGGWLQYRKLATPDRQARVAVSAVCAVGAVLVLLSAGGGGIALLLGLTVAIAAALWLPPDARTWYGDKPLAWSATEPTQ